MVPCRGSSPTHRGSASRGVGGPWQSAVVDFLGTLHTMQDAFAATIPLVDLDAPVAGCPPWAAHDLVVHLAQVHHWAAAQARGAVETPLDADTDNLVDLYDACATELRTTFAELDPGAPATTLVGPGPVVFWHRRQVHETLVHLWDLRTAAGLDVEVEPEIWADGVDEIVTMFEPRQVRLGRIPPLARGVALAAADAPGRWLLGSHQPQAPVTVADVTVTGPAKSLALMLWHRIAPAEAGVLVSGDRSALDDALAAHITP